MIRLGTPRRCAHRGAYRTEFQYGTLLCVALGCEQGAYRTELQYGTLLRTRGVSGRGPYRTASQYGTPPRTPPGPNEGAYRTKIHYDTLFGVHDVGAYITEYFPKETVRNHLVKYAPTSCAMTSVPY